jgi:ABC-type phosphate transport system substrate-binding protein
MKAVRKQALMLVFVLATVVPSFAHHMAVVVDKDNRTGVVSSVYLAKLFRADVRKWVDGRDVVIVLHKDSPGEAETLQRLTKMSAADLKAFLAVHKDSIKTADSDDDMLKLVESTPGAIGLVEVHAINDQVNVLKVDGRLPLEAGYLPH